MKIWERDLENQFIRSKSIRFSQQRKNVKKLNNNNNKIQKRIPHEDISLQIESAHQMHG